MCQGEGTLSSLGPIMLEEAGGLLETTLGAELCIVILGLRW